MSCCQIWSASGGSDGSAFSGSGIQVMKRIKLAKLCAGTERLGSLNPLVRWKRSWQLMAASESMLPPSCEGVNVFKWGTIDDKGDI
ncbi:hypothetical protein PVAP13_9KG197700 [Panicum virgatum]|uniref:Uncharacterized protein n=1 Tax=Panicum virgatum TaxID=38727 RepID=A0A8T0NJ95_PANVG|nr:hypothetical protein PVAP13_9KG197700 [Panicum virgatum]